MNQSASHSKKQAVLSLSGGMDSSTLLLHLLANDYEVTALSFDYGQKHKVELERATDLVQYINQNLDNWNSKENPYPKVKHQIIKLDGLAQLLNSSLVEGGSEVPEGHYAAENMKDTVVPNRNKIFSSIIQAVALSIADKKDTECSIAMGIHSGDHEIYLDCRQDFRDADFDAFIIGNWGAENVNVYTPYIDTDKFGILEDGEICCKTLGLDFDEVYYRTNTSYKPIYYVLGEGQKTGILGEYNKDGSEKGKWYSDYKSASSVERIEAFMKLGRPDPVPYADETGPVSWETVVSHVEQILTNHN
jgi:7-cyano-7-deazaguanine synthase